MLATIDPAINLKQNPPSSPEYSVASKVGIASPFNVYKYLMLGWRKLVFDSFAFAKRLEEKRTEGNRY
jgi:hypothetical protein